jgi:predicted nucleotide-binding protein (sugar kinase/HSP70/actin superfamily)
MGAAAAQTYRAYAPRPFTREERPNTTILYGGLSWRAERVLQGLLENLGYRARPLPPPTREDLLTGRELADVGQCCPTSFTAGNLANFLKAETAKLGAEEVTRRYVYLTAGACGACRFGQYHQSYSLALRNIGLDSFRMFLMAQDEMDQSGGDGQGLELNMQFTLGGVWAVFCTDLLQDLEYQVRPFEMVEGQTDGVLRESVEELYELFRKRPLRGKKWGALAWHLSTDYFASALRRIRRKFDAIEVDRLRVKPVVKITGEFYLEHVENEANHNIHRWLESEGAEVQPSPLSVWLDYLMRCHATRFARYRGIDRYAGLKRTLVRSVAGLYRWTYNRLCRALGDQPHELPHQYELERLAAPYYHAGLEAGEGDMLIGKALYAHLNHHAHMICELSPYACMPNTMSVGAMANVLGRHPDLLYAPLEIKGDSEVHVLSRCQMILTEARKRAQREFEDALDRAHLSAGRVRDWLERRPEMRRATFRVPHANVAGTAANLVLFASRMGCRP